MDYQEQTLFLRLYKHGTMDEVRAAFPNRPNKHFYKWAERLKITRPRKSYIETGDYLLDTLRMRCSEENVTMPDLDVIAKAGRYFADQRYWGRIDQTIIVRAIGEMGGTINVKWDQE